jgi:hypothetical protein
MDMKKVRLFMVGLMAVALLVSAITNWAAVQDSNVNSSNFYITPLTIGILIAHYSGVVPYSALEVKALLFVLLGIVINYVLSSLNTEDVYNIGEVFVPAGINGIAGLMLAYSLVSELRK